MPVIVCLSILITLWSLTIDLQTLNHQLSAPTGHPYSALPMTHQLYTPAQVTSVSGNNILMHNQSVPANLHLQVR